MNTFLGYGMRVGGAITVISLTAPGAVVTLNSFGRAGDHAEVIVKGLAMVVAGAVLTTSATCLGKLLTPGI